METEELGSVYESLLELTPRIADDGRVFSFAEGAEAQGHARKTTGSYYTPDSLVQALLNSALDPVLDRAEAQSESPSSRCSRSASSIRPAAPAISCSPRRDVSPPAWRVCAAMGSRQSKTTATPRATSPASVSMASTAIRWRSS